MKNRNNTSQGQFTNHDLNYQNAYFIKLSVFAPFISHSFNVCNYLEIAGINSHEIPTSIYIVNNVHDLHCSLDFYISNYCSIK